LINRRLIWARFFFARREPFLSPKRPLIVRAALGGPIKRGSIVMFKIRSLRAPLAAIAFGALALGAASLAPSAASAKGFHGGGFHGGGFGHLGGFGHHGFGHRHWGWGRGWGYVGYGGCYLSRGINDFGEVVVVRRCY